MQVFLLQALFPILIVGVVLPVGLVAIFLALSEAAIGEAVSHGELWLGAGNAGLIGCLSLIASRHDAGLNAAITTLYTMAIVVIPCYAFWAGFSVRVIEGEAYSKVLAAEGGAIAAGAAVMFGVALVMLASQPPQPNESQ